MDAKTTLKSKLPSRHVTKEPERAHRSDSYMPGRSVGVNLNRVRGNKEKAGAVTRSGAAAERACYADI